MAKTKNPGNYGQGPLTPTLPPFNPRRDLSNGSLVFDFHPPNAPPRLFLSRARARAARFLRIFNIPLDARDRADSSSRATAKRNVILMSARGLKHNIRREAARIYTRDDK